MQPARTSEVREESPYSWRSTSPPRSGERWRLTGGGHWPRLPPITRGG